jgi:hypothetical protein
MRTVKRRVIFLYAIALSIPLLLGVVAWQSFRYATLEREIAQLEATQKIWVEGNKSLIALITSLSGPERIEDYAVRVLGLKKIRPDQVMQVRIEGR